MKNTASVYNDGECVYFNSKIKIGNGVKTILIFSNLFFITFIILILSHSSSDSPTEHKNIVPYIILPSLYLFTLGRISLWNLFGEEQIIIIVKTIVYRKNFGFFSTSFKTIQYKKLRSCLNQDKVFDRQPYGTISFFDNTQLDIPMPIFSSSIYVPMDILFELDNQLAFVFCIEHLTQLGDDYINLN